MDGPTSSTAAHTADAGKPLAGPSLSDATPPRKRRRNLKPSPAPSHKKPKTHHTATSRACDDDEASKAGPSDFALSFSDPSELMSKAPDAIRTRRLRASSRHIPDASASTSVVGAEMRRLKQDLDEVTEQLRQEQHQRVQNECQIRQDMLLEKLQAEKKAQCETEKLERHLRMAWKVIDQKEQALEDLQKKYDSTSHSLGTYLIEWEAQKQDLQHLRDLNATLEGDIDELRQIHNEGLTTKRPPGLPPAYGSLDEEDLPPYDIHKDSGALNVATLKHLTRARFDQTLRAFGSTGPTYQMSIETANMPGLRTFCKASLALFEAVACLQKAGDGELNRFGVDVHSGTTDGVQRLTAAKSFMAARVANLVLELGWRTLALNEVRPQSCVFTPRALSFLKNMYSGVDDVLLETIRQWNAESKTNWGIFVEKEEARAEEFQVYLTQLVALRSRFRLLVTQTRPSSPRWSGEFFCKSILFLQEAVEKERMQQANILRSQSKELERAEREVSVISSDGIPMKVESEEDDAW